MAHISTPKEKKVKSEKKTPSPFAKNKNPVYCIVCRREYLKHEGHDHLHSMLHHRELEAATGKKKLHTCQACKVHSMNLQQYAEHISTTRHKACFKTLLSKNVKPESLHKVLDAETIKMIMQRNKALRKQEKKVKGKVKKKQKQAAAQESAHLKTKVKKTEASSKWKKGKPMHGRNQECSNNAVFQNIENKVSAFQRPPWNPYSFPQNQSARGAHLPQFPTGPAQPARHMSPNNYSFSSQHSNQAWGAQRHTYHRRPYRFHMPQQPPWPAGGQYYPEQHQNYLTDEDFRSDHIPHSTYFFDQNQGASQGESQPSCSAQPTSRNPPVSSAPIGDADVSGMLKQIRRALGVREPCRADREARKQNKEASSSVADGGTAHQPAGGEIKQSASTSATTTPGPSAQISSISSAKPKNDKVQEPSENSSEDVNGLLGGNRKESHPTTDNQTSLSQSTIETTFCERTNGKGKVRIAHNSAKAQELMKTKLQPTLNKLQTSLSTASSKQNMSQMKDVVKVKTRSIPRFATKMVNREEDQEGSEQPVNNDLPLSEGFQWESFSQSPSASHSTLQPASQHTASTTCHTQSDSVTQKPLEQPGTANQTEATLTIKVEPNLGNENLDSRENNGVRKRKLNIVPNDGLPDQEQSAKKKKTKSNNDQDQMDQLLAVSLREEELSQSMVELDKSLIQARNALQAAYAEVQRLLIMRQQFMAEVNTLRAKRIEILQGMQEGFSETSNAAEKATTSSAAAAAASSAFPSSSSQSSPATPTASPIPVPQPAPIVSLKQEISREACSSPETASHTTDASPSHSAIPATAAAPTKQPQAQCSSSLNTHPPPESSPQLHEKEKREELQGSIRRETAAVKGEEMRGNLSQVSTAENADAKGVKFTSAAVDEGNESDASIEMVSYSAQEIIHIDESDKEDSPATPDEPQTSVTVESTCASTQTSQQTEPEKKYKLPMPVKDANSPSAPVEDEEPSLGSFLNHTGSVHGLQIHDGRLYTCSGDNTARAYSLVTRECLTVFEGHTNKVNCLLVSSSSNMPPRLYTGSSDQTICCFSIKTNKCLEKISLPDRVLCLHIAWNILYAGLANGSVASYDLKTLKQVDMLECHGPRGVSCLGTAQEGARRLLLVGSYDSTISVRDAKSGLLLRTLEGHTKTVLCMKIVNDLVFSGSSDTSVHAHNIHTGELVRIYKGHGHAVTSIVILGKVMVTACLDKLIRVYELQSHDRLQVYGGHSDMVMCMAVHKSVIYTGCYDGTVQAVKLNLMKNYRCWWQNCSLIFGIADHLVQHLVNDHSNPNLQTVKCRWRGCVTFFSSQKSVQQDVPEHMKAHVQNNSKVQP